jgi:hypothetical protein
LGGPCTSGNGPGIEARKTAELAGLFHMIEIFLRANIPASR